MPDEAAHLRESDRHIAEGQQRIAEQRLRIVKLEGAGYDARNSRELLRHFETTLELMFLHRAQILRELQRLLKR
jgi:hypothetical protein